MSISEYMSFFFSSSSFVVFVALVAFDASFGISCYMESKTTLDAARVPYRLPSAIYLSCFLLRLLASARLRGLQDLEALTHLLLATARHVLADHAPRVAVLGLRREQLRVLHLAPPAGRGLSLCQLRKSRSAFFGLGVKL